MHTQIQHFNPLLTADRWKPLIWWNAGFRFHFVHISHSSPAPLHHFNLVCCCYKFKCQSINTIQIKEPTLIVRQICFDGAFAFPNVSFGKQDFKWLHPVVFSLVSYYNCSFSRIKEVQPQQQQRVSANPPQPCFLLTFFEYPCNYSCLNFFCMF